MMVGCPWLAGGDRDMLRALLLLLRHDLTNFLFFQKSVFYFGDEEDSRAMSLGHELTIASSKAEMNTAFEFELKYSCCDLLTGWSDRLEVAMSDESLPWWSAVHHFVYRADGPSCSNSHGSVCLDLNRMRLQNASACNKLDHGTAMGPAKDSAYQAGSVFALYIR